MMCSQSIFFSYGVFYRPLIDEFGWTVANLALAPSIRSLITLLLVLPISWLYEKYGAKTLILFGGILLGVSLILSSKVTILWQLYFSYSFIGGIGSSAIYVPLTSTIVKWFDKNRGIALGITLSGFGFGLFFFAPLLGHLIIIYGWRITFLVAGVSSFLMIFLAGLVIRDNPQEMGLNPYGENRRKVFEPHVNLSQITDSTWNLSVREALGKSKLWILYTFIAIGSIVREIYRQQIILFGIQLGIKPVIAAMALGVIGSSSILGRLIGGFFLERIGIRRAIILFYIINVFSTLIIIRAKDQFSLFLFAIIFGFAIGGATVIEVPLIVELFGLKNLGMFIGIFETAIGLGAFTGSYYAGFLFDLMGRYNELFLSCMLFSITSLLFSIILSRAKFHQEPSY